MANITPRGRNKWLVRIFLGRSPEGNPTFRNKTITGSKKDAEAWAHEEKRRAQLLGTNAAVRILVSELLDDLERYYRINGLSVDWCSLVVRVHLRPYFGHVVASSLTTSHAQAYIDKRLSAGAKAGTVNRELGLLRRALNLAATECTPPKLDRVPKIPRLEEDAPRKGFFEDHEYRALLGELPERLRPILALGYHTGCRRGEVLSLQWPQVDLAEGIIRLDPGTTKNGRGRSIPLNAELVEIFRMQKSIRDARHPRCEWVFFDEAGNRILDFRGAWNAACKRAGIVDGQGKVTALFHDLRRTAVRNMVRAGVPEKVAMQISGHQSRSVFDRYDIVTERDLKLAVGRQYSYVTELRAKAEQERSEGKTEGSCTIVALQPNQGIQ
jgi:integrase